MKCPRCAEKTKVYDSRWYSMPFGKHEKCGYVERRRQCLKCGFKFVTQETYYRDAVSPGRPKEV